VSERAPESPVLGRVDLADQTVHPGAESEPIVDELRAEEALGLVQPTATEQPSAYGPRRRRVPPLVAAAIGWLALVGFVAIFVSVLPIPDPNELTGSVARRPGFRLDEPLGSDILGRSLLGRVAYGARVSFIVALGATAVGMSVGGTIGLVSGYVKGALGWTLDTVVDVVLAVPPLIFLIALASVLKPGIPSLLIALGTLSSPLFARVARANTLAAAERDYVTAARVLGVGRMRIIFHEVLPNVFPAVFSFSLIVMAVVMVAEGSLSFLGLGIPPPTSSWGGIIESGRARLETDPHLIFVPAVPFVLTVLSFNVVGDWIRARTGGSR
jgi:peptide/nickel transport system permease protein